MQIIGLLTARCGYHFINLSETWDVAIFHTWLTWLTFLTGLTQDLL